MQLYEAFGESKSWALWRSDPRFVANHRTVRTRLASGWDFERAITQGPKPVPTHTAFGETKRLKDWISDPRCQVLGATLLSRLQLGWSFEDALVTAPDAPMHEAYGEFKSLTAWTRDDRSQVKSYKLLQRRLDEGMTLEEALALPGDRRYYAFGEMKTFRSWLEDERCLVTKQTLRHRMEDAKTKHGDDIEDFLIRPVNNIPVYEAFGEVKSLSDWALDYRCIHHDRELLASRLLQYGWDLVSAMNSDYYHKFNTPHYSAFGESKPLVDWLKDKRCNIDNISTLQSRFLEHKWSLEDSLTRGKLLFVSKLESDLADFIESHIPIERSNRSLIAPKELDIYIPSKNIAIEFNGLYWHSEQRVGRLYHRDKYRACKDKGVRLIQIWEDDWLFRRSVVESMLLNRLGLSNSDKIGARKTEIDRTVPLSEAREFLDSYHVQGFTSASYRYGLRYEGRLVALLSMKSVSDQDADWDLVRYATSASVPGGFTRLLKAFRADHDGAIKTFADLTLSDGDLYYQAGFKEVEILDPDYSYVRSGDRVREHKFGYRKARFESDPELQFHADMTETQLAELNGLYRIYDAGKIKFILD